MPRTSPLSRAPPLLVLLFLLGSSGLRGQGPAPAPRVSVNETHILVDGAPLFLKGIDYSPFIAGDAPWTGARKVNFRDDLREIKERLHANAVRIYDPLPKSFYDAARQEGLWIIQGIFLPDAPDLLAALEDHKAMVEVALETIDRAGAGDVILAYVLGSGLSTASVAETIWSRQSHPRYSGRRYSVPPENDLPRVDRYVEVKECERCEDPDFTRTPELYPHERFPDPHPFQSYLAELADHLSSLEVDAGRPRPLVGHATTPANNAFLGARDRAVPEIDLPVPLGFLDVVFENVFSYADPYIAYHGFPAYLQRLKTAYPNVPVVILETGYSTSPEGAPSIGRLCGFVRDEPLPLTLTFGGASEAQQAAGIEARWVDVVTAPRPLAGLFIYSFYDEWWFGGDPERQDPDQPLEHFGLKRVSGTPGRPRIEEKEAYAVVATLFGCEEPDAEPGECGLVIRSPRRLDATFGASVEGLRLEAAGAAAPLWSLEPPDSLPPGLRLDEATGALHGTPERMGTFRFRLTVSDLRGAERSRSRLTVLSVGPPTFSTHPETRQILLNGAPFYLRGVDYSNFIAGDAPWSSMTIADPWTDMRAIKEELHANAIRLYQVVPQTVYDAARAHGLFIIQGIHLQIDCPTLPSCPFPGDPMCVSEDPSELGPVDLLGPDYFPAFQEHVVKELDDIHSFGAGDTILAYVVGNELSFCASRATILRNQDRPRYKGAYYSVPEAGASRLPEADRLPGCEPPVDHFWDPHPLQSMVTELIDLAAIREAERYGVRHLMATATEPNMSVVPSAKHRFEPREHFPVDFGFLDIVFQNVYSYFPPYIRYFGMRTYLKECASERGYPRTPFVILECGYSTSPQAESPGFCATTNFYTPSCPALPTVPHPMSLCFGVNSVEEQASGLAFQFGEATRPEPDGSLLSAGFFVFEYYDEWWKGSGATQGEFVQDPNRAEEWFGIRGVHGVRGDCGDRSRLQIVNKPAFDAVAAMFSGFEPPSRRFRRGDVDLNGSVQLTDAVAILDYLFRGEAVLDCLEAADTDDGGSINITDSVRVLGYLFLGGAAPSPPGPVDCGADPVGPEPHLGCEAALSCP